MDPFLVGSVTFGATLCVIVVIYLVYQSLRHPHHGRIRKRIKAIATNDDNAQSTDLVRKKVLSDVPLLNGLLRHVPGVDSLDRLIQQADAKNPAGVFILSAVVLALSGFLLCFLTTRSHLMGLAVAAAAGVLPFVYLAQRKKRRMERFHSQFPDALGLLARALRAGHAFTSGLRLAADEFGDPLGPELDKTLDEINFGVSDADALKNLASRLDCPEVRYFVVALIIQRQAGGNLAEIIEKLAHLIRERFKLQGKIKVLSAEGRLSAAILIGLPFVVLIVLLLLSPNYLTSLFSEPAGRWMLGAAAFMMVLGILVMRRMIQIKI